MVTGLETLPTFRPDALVFFRAKEEVSTRAIHFYSCTKVIIGCRRKPLLAAGSCGLVAGWPPPHCASMQPSNTWGPGDSLPPIPVEAFPSRGPLDVDGLFQQEFLRSPGPVDHRCVFPVDVVVANPDVLCKPTLARPSGGWKPG